MRHEVRDRRSPSCLGDRPSIGVEEAPVVEEGGLPTVSPARRKTGRACRTPPAPPALTATLEDQRPLTEEPSALDPRQARRGPIRLRQCGARRPRSRRMKARDIRASASACFDRPVVVPDSRAQPGLRGLQIADLLERECRCALSRPDRLGRHAGPDHRPTRHPPREAPLVGRCRPDPMRAAPGEHVRVGHRIDSAGTRP